MPVQIQVRRDTAANWTSINPVLAEGELGLETDTGKFKFGDGSTAWTSLGYGAVSFSPSVTEFLVDTNTWAVPAGASVIEFIAIGGGGHGGSGRKGSIGGVRTGGGGGGGGGLSRLLVNASLVASLLDVHVGAGSITGGTAQAGADTDGVDGTAGGNSWVAPTGGAISAAYIVAGGGGGGLKGTSVQSNGGTGGNGLEAGQAGGSSLTALAGGMGMQVVGATFAGGVAGGGFGGAGGGGGGGAITGANNGLAGGNGSVGGLWMGGQGPAAATNANQAAGPTNIGGAAGAVEVNGTAGSAPALAGLPGKGGGGGGGYNNVTRAGNGGAGSAPGGGGGGGGGGKTAVADSGAGGIGASGAVYIRVW